MPSEFVGALPSRAVLPARVGAVGFPAALALLEGGRNVGDDCGHETQPPSTQPRAVAGVVL